MTQPVTTIKTSRGMEVARQLRIFITYADNLSEDEINLLEEAATRLWEADARDCREEEQEGRRCIYIGEQI